MRQQRRKIIKYLALAQSSDARFSIAQCIHERTHAMNDTEANSMRTRKALIVSIAGRKSLEKFDERLTCDWCDGGRNRIQTVSAVINWIHKLYSRIDARTLSIYSSVYIELRQLSKCMRSIVASHNHHCIRFETRRWRQRRHTRTL